MTLLGDASFPVGGGAPLLETYIADCPLSVARTGTSWSAGASNHLRSERTNR